MRNETANNLKKLRETINDCIKCSSEYLQLFQDGGSASKLYRTKIDLESIEKITRKFVNCSGNIVKEEIPRQEEYTIELPMGAQLVENLQKLEKVISNFIQYVDDYNKLERGEQYPALFQYPGEDNFIILGKIVQESFLGMTSENLHNGQEIESEDNKEIDNRFPQTNINDMLRFSTEQNTETLDSETTMNERNLILELRTVFQANPELFKKFQVEFLKFFRAKQDNLSQDTLNSLTTSNSLLSYLQSDSWCTSWSYSSSISDSLGHREVLYGNQNQPEEFAQHSLKDVHSILSRQARMLNDTDSLSSFINPSSVHGQESLQTSLESNSISMRHPQFIRSYDVDNKNFDSINVLLITRNDSLSINDNAKTEGCDDWVYRPASSLEQETIRLNERNQYRSGENIELSNDNSSTEQDEIRNKEEWRQTQQKVDDLESKSGEVTKLNGTIENLKKMNAGLEGKINNLTSQVGRLSEEKGALNIQFAEKEKLLNGKIGELEHQLRKQKEELDSTKQSLVSEVRSSEAQNSGRFTPESGIENQLCAYSVRDKEFVTSIQKFLKEQKDSIEYHKKLFEVVEQNKDLRSLADIIAEDGPIGIMGLQVCSKVIPQILRVPGIKLAVKGTIAEGEVEQEFSQGPVIYVEGNSLRYYDLLNKIISCFEDNPVVKDLSSPKSKTLSYKMFYYINSNTEAIKQELWGKHEVDSTPETKKEEDNVTARHVVQKEPDKKNQGTVKQHGEKKTGDDADSKEKREETTSKKTVMRHPPVNSGVYSQKEPPIFSRKQKIAIAVGIVAALATALVCYSVQLPILAIVVSALIVGAGAYMISSKLYEVVVCDGTSQQPGF